MINVKYTSAIRDSSGYGAAARNYIGALLDTKKVNLTVGEKSFEQQKTTHGSLMKRIEPLIDKPLNHKIHIAHLTPENYPSVLSPRAYNIGYTVWETDTLPAQWVPLCNMMDEIWVPSTWNIKVFKKSGITKPIYKIPHVIPIPDLSDMKNVTVTKDEDTFVFYTIQQWIERKHPAGLLKAYLTEFQNDEDVCLALKTYRLNTSGKEQEVIKKDITSIKQSLRLNKYPPILFFGNLLPAEYMKGLHHRGDCFVLVHRGEGFSITHAEAMAFGKPTIGTKYSGNLEFMTEENSFLVNCQETPVSGMIFGNYNGSMTWAEPDIMHLRKIMRYCYENQKEIKKKGAKAREDIKNNLSSAVIGKMMVKRLEEIEKGI